MAHQIEGVKEGIKSARYGWRLGGRENFLKLETRGTPQPLAEGSVQEFIAEHYWGYARQRNGSTMEYRVEHPRWRIWETQSAELHCDSARLYGQGFEPFLDRPPLSAFLADGSEVCVYGGVRL